jgi:calcineurin-like phosphoesterase family protein
MNTFFTSDTHFDDEYVIRYFNRPFNSVDEMNAVIVEKWNSVVTENDMVYHLGDFTLDDIDHFTKWVSRLNGNIKILPGSHDHLWLEEILEKLCCRASECWLIDDSAENIRVAAS